MMEEPKNHQNSKKHNFLSKKTRDIIGATSLAVLAVIGANQFIEADETKPEGDEIYTELTSLYNERKLGLINTLFKKNNIEDLLSDTEKAILMTELRQTEEKILIAFDKEIKQGKKQIERYKDEINDNKLIIKPELNSKKQIINFGHIAGEVEKILRLRYSKEYAQKAIDDLIRNSHNITIKLRENIEGHLGYELEAIIIDEKIITTKDEPKSGTNYYRYKS